MDKEYRTFSTAGLTAVSLLAISMAATPALAQQQSQSAIGEIVVTAERRAQSAQDVPLALTTITADTITPGQVANLQDIALKTPNLTITEFNIAEPQLYLRGIGSTLDSAAADPTVSVFLDDVYMGRSGGAAFELYDLERIEVLRGPQGTLYGRNVTGGAISIYSSRPSEDFRGKIGLTVGNHGLSVIRGFLTGPITDDLSGKISFSKLDRGGYSRNVLTGQPADDANNFSIRGQLRYYTGNTEFLLTGDFSRDRTNGNCRYISKLDSADQAFDGIFADDTRLHQQLLGINGPRDCAVSMHQFGKRNMGGLSLRIQHDMDWATLTSITAWRYNKYSWAQELGGMDVPPSYVSVEDHEGETGNQWTQEFRLGGVAMEDRLNWVVGLYGLHDHVDRFADVPIRFGPTSPINTGVLLDRAWAQDATSKSAAIFGQATYELVDGLSLTLGGRYTYDKKSIDQFYRQGSVVEFDLKDLSKSWKKFTGRVTIDWKITPDIMAYATYSEGYKSGIFISQSTSGPAAATPLRPESATNWEAGIKSQLLDRHVQFNATFFNMTVKDLQLFRLIGLALESENTDAKVRGIETDLQVVPVDGLRLGGSLSLLDPKYRGGTYDGNQLDRAPKWKYTLDGSYTHYLPNDGRLMLNASFTRTSKYFFESLNTASSMVKPHNKLDASVQYTSPNERWDLSVWGKNLTDTLVETHMILGVTAGSVTLYQPPRTFGASFNVNF